MKSIQHPGGEPQQTVGCGLLKSCKWGFCKLSIRFHKSFNITFISILGQKTPGCQSHFEMYMLVQDDWPDIFEFHFGGNFPSRLNLRNQIQVSRQHSDPYFFVWPAPSHDLVVTQFLVMLFPDSLMLSLTVTDTNITITTIIHPKFPKSYYCV